MRRGLVLEGGAMRGMFSAGVLDALMEAGIVFDGVIGVSVGACVGCNYKSHQPGRTIRYNRKYARDPRYCSVRSLLATGDIFNAKFCYHDLPERLEPFDRHAFEADPSEFYCVTTDCRTGMPVYRRCVRADAETFDWIRASASMPLAARPVELDGRLQLDGGLSDGIPFRYFESIGFDRNVVITTRPRDYRKHPSALHVLMRPLLRDLPAVYRALRRRHVAYNAAKDALAEGERAGTVFVLAPEEPLPIGRICHDPGRLQHVYDIGLCLGRKHVAAVRHFLQPRPDV